MSVGDDVSSSSYGTSAGGPSETRESELSQHPGTAPDTELLARGVPGLTTVSFGVN